KQRVVALSRAPVRRTRKLLREPQRRRVRGPLFPQASPASKADGTQKPTEIRSLTEVREEWNESASESARRNRQPFLRTASHLIRRGAPARQLRKVSHLTVARGAASRQNDFASAGAALALPLVILAQFLLVLFHLSFQVAECLGEKAPRETAQGLREEHTSELQSPDHLVSR